MIADITKNLTRCVSIVSCDLLDNFSILVNQTIEFASKFKSHFDLDFNFRS